MTSRLTKDKKDKVAQVAGITNASTRVATECLAASGWDTSAAINYFFSGVGQTGAGGAAGRLDRCGVWAGGWTAQGMQGLVMGAGGMGSWRCGGAGAGRGGGTVFFPPPNPFGH